MNESIHPADAGQAHAVVQATQARGQAIEKVVACHERFMASGRSISESLVDAVNELRQMGVHLTELKKISRGQFTKLFRMDNNGKVNPASPFDFSHSWGCACMRLAAKMPEPIAAVPENVHSVKELLQLLGVVPETTRGKQNSRGQLAWLSIFQRQLMTAEALVVKQLETRGELRTWDRAELQTLEEHLRPFAERHRAAAEILKKGAKGSK